MGVAVLAFASCAKDTVSETNNGRAIDFRVATETRAAEVDAASLTKFSVTAFSTGKSTTKDETTNEDVITYTETTDQYFTDVEFTRGNDSFYTSLQSYYWPQVNGLTFYAYANAQGAPAWDTKTLSFTPNATISEQLDFVVAKAYGDYNNQSSGVPLIFNHMLSQIEVKAKNGDNRYAFKVAGHCCPLKVVDGFKS